MASFTQDTLSVMLCTEIPIEVLHQFWSKYELTIINNDDNYPIPGSFWGDSEAGLIGNKLYIRHDTPLHSLFHEACHYICMDRHRRETLHTNAGGDYDEENAVCYLQILLAEQLQGFSSQRMMQDMNSWGYSFRLGSSERWFSDDAKEAKDWLIRNNIITPSIAITYQTNQ